MLSEEYEKLTSGNISITLSALKTGWWKVREKTAYGFVCSTSEKKPLQWAEMIPQMRTPL